MGITSSSTRSFAGFPRHVPLDSAAHIVQSFATDQSGRAGAVPLAVARPSSSTDLQKIVRWAVKKQVPLVPVSSRDGPRRRGDTVCDRQTVVVDLSSMDRIGHIDGRDAIAIIEPGVTFGQFDAALKPYGLRSFRPLVARAGKSVLAAFLEREPMTVPGKHWDSADPLAAMELVFGTGDLFRTGGAALPGSLEENLAIGNRQMLGVGPMHTDFGRVIQGSQGALGIVSWASIYCQRIPALEVPLFAASDNLDVVVDLAYAMLHRRPAGQLFIMNGRQLALLLADSADQFDTVAAALPTWILFVELSATKHFPNEAIAYQRADLERDAASLGVTVTGELAGVPADDFAARLKKPSAPPGAAMGLASQEVFCLSQLDKLRQHLDALAPNDVDDACIYVQPLAHGVNAHCQLTFLANPGQDRALARRAIDAGERLADSGGFFSRPYHPWAHIAFERDKAIIPLLARTKTLFDPNSVLQPGAQSLGVSL